MQPITLASVSSTQKYRRTHKKFVLSLGMAKRVYIRLLGLKTCVTEQRRMSIGGAF